MPAHLYAEFRILDLAGFSRMITVPDMTRKTHSSSHRFLPAYEEFKQLTGKNIFIGTSTRAGTEW